MKRVLIDVQSIQNDPALAGTRWGYRLQVLLEFAETSGFQIHLLINGAFPKAVPAFSRLFSKLYEAGQIHVFYGLRGRDDDCFDYDWRQAVSSCIWGACVREIAPDLIVLPDLLFDAGGEGVLAPRGMQDTPVLGIVPDLPSGAVGPSRFASEASRQRFLRARLGLAEQDYPVLAGSDAIAKELAVHAVGDVEVWPDAAPQSVLNEIHSFLAVMRKVLETRAPVARKTLLGWPDVQSSLDASQERLIAALAACQPPKGGLTEWDWAALARAVDQTRLAQEDRYRRALPSHEQINWRIEGPFDSSYSLASVNRETALSLDRQGVDVVLRSSEGGGDYDADPAFLSANPTLSAFSKKADQRLAVQADVCSRNMFPPRCDDMVSRFNILHGYAWEETGFPSAFSRDINAYLQGILVTSDHVRRTLVNAGVSPMIETVGNGVDHLMIDPAPLPFELPRTGFQILHVSSCFPRKGADALLAAYAAAFTRGDNVCLILKTHGNPHNTVAEDVARIQVEHPDMAPVHIIFEDLSPAQMRSLYEQADLLVAPSRAEGFCLPVAEAVLAGTPVLTTGWSGQMIFDGVPLVRFIDYRFVRAESHLESWNSVWAEPDVGHLVQLMQEAHGAPVVSDDQKAVARQVLLETHSWDAVAVRSITALDKIRQTKPAPAPRIAWVSTFNTRCGIATYSGHLIKSLPDEVQIFATKHVETVGPDDRRITRCWVQGHDDPLEDLAQALWDSRADVIVIQFNYGFFNFSRLAGLIEDLKDAGRTVVMVLHSTDDAPLPQGLKLAEIARTLQRCDKLLVHALHDLNRLKALGLIDNVALFPHGVPLAKAVARKPVKQNGPVVLGTYGFFLPQKGLIELIEATALLRDRGFDVRLNMVNAAYPVPESITYIAQAQALIAKRGLGRFVKTCTDFLDDAESFALLADSDLLVFPYGPTSESASGAVRQALAVHRPVAVTPLPIFDDVKDLVHYLPGFDAERIADGVESLITALACTDEAGAIVRTNSKVDAWREAHLYGVLGARLWNILASAHRDKDLPR